MRQPLLPCPKCMTGLEEEGVIYPDGRVVARDLAMRLDGVLKGVPLGVRYVCTRCGSAHSVPLPSRSVAS